MLLLVTLYLLVVIVLPLGLSAAVSYRTLPGSTHCPLCHEETYRLLARWLRWLSRLTPGSTLQRRWCPGCGWEGMCRIGVARPAAPRPAATPAPRRPRMATVAHADPGRTTDLRSLDLEGRRWRVLLQCWREGTGWQGRLLFVSPTGRMWADSTTEPLRGHTHHDVLIRARTLPDRFLTTRLREVVTD